VKLGNGLLVIRVGDACVIEVKRTCSQYMPQVGRLLNLASVDTQNRQLIDTSKPAIN
jgi:hypothetical protein